MTDQNKAVLKITEENKASLIAGIKSGAAIVINIVDVESGQAEIEVGTFFTGTADQRKDDPRHRAISLFAASLSEFIQAGLDGGFTGAAVTKVIKSEPSLARIFEPELPEEMLKIFDESETYAEAMKMMKEQSVGVKCDCPGCAKKREESAAGPEGTATGGTVN